ncbi:MAG: type II secretion system F family protein [Candidatus Nanohaloarchaea archaeon]
MELIPQDYRLQLRNIWRKNKRLITLITVAAVIGITVAAVNTWHFQNNKVKFQLEETRTISNNDRAEFNFALENPSQPADTTLRMEIQNITAQTILVLKINGEQIKEIENTNPIIKLQPEVLEKENKVVIVKQNLGFTDQRLVYAQVTSFTNLQQLVFVLLNFASILLIFSPIGYVKYQDYIRRKKMEDEFPAFLRDVVEGTRAGMSLPQAIQNTETGSYGPLDDKIEKMSAQIEWGVPFDEVLENFGEETRSAVVQRSVDTIIQAYTSGGNIQDVLESVGDNIRSIKQLKEERQSQLYGEMITGYIVYFIFIGILIALTTFLLPNLANASASLGGGLNVLGNSGGSSLRQNISLYKTWFQRLVYIQAFFSGLIIGKLSEGEMKAGIKHSAILFAIGYLAITFFL